MIDYADSSHNQDRPLSGSIIDSAATLYGVGVEPTRIVLACSESGL
jgi:hypothetical protein